MSAARLAQVAEMAQPLNMSRVHRILSYCTIMNPELWENFMFGLEFLNCGK
jgi:hypothetical protein